MFNLSNTWFVSIIGGTLATTFGGIALYYLLKFKEYLKINKKATLRKGMSLSFKQLTVNLKVGKIQELSDISKSSAIVLPANTTFIDDCITDSNSALGAYFLRYHGERISKVSQDILSQLERLGYKRGENGSYPLGTTIILPNGYNTPAKTILTASTIRKEITGIRAEPSSICECIRQTFQVTADKKISEVYIPILGSGHGGLNVNDKCNLITVIF